MKMILNMLMLLSALLFFFGCSDDDPAAPREPSPPTMLIENAWQPCWSPDGETIYFMRWVEAYEISQVMALVWGETEPVELFRARTLANPMASPDGEHLVCFRFNDGTGECWFEKYTLAGELVVSWPVEDFWGTGPALSPDGQEVLFTMHDETDPIDPPIPIAGFCSPEDENPYYVVALDLENGGVRILREGVTGVLSPQGDRLAFQSCERNLDEAFTVCQVRVARVLEEESSVVGPGAWPTWMPDGRGLVYTGLRSAELSDLVLVRLNFMTKVWLTDDPEIEWDSAVSPDGKTILYTRSAGEWEPRSIWVIEY